MYRQSVCLWQSPTMPRPIWRGWLSWTSWQGGTSLACSHLCYYRCGPVCAFPCNYDISLSEVCVCRGVLYWLYPSVTIQINIVTDSFYIWAPSSKFVSLSIPSWQIVTAHAQPFRGARDLAFCLKVPLDPLLVWASSGGSGETARMRRLAWTFAARIGDKYQIRLTRSIYDRLEQNEFHSFKIGPK